MSAFARKLVTDITDSTSDGIKNDLAPALELFGYYGPLYLVQNSHADRLGVSAREDGPSRA